MAARLVTKVFTLDAAEKFVEANPNVRWDGWDIVTWVHNPKAFYSAKGAFNRNSQSGRGWGYEYRTPISSDGKYRVKIVSS